MLMILNMSGEDSNKLGEYNFNRSACGGGGEQMFLRWNEATHDPLHIRDGQMAVSRFEAV